MPSLCYGECSGMFNLDWTKNSTIKNLTNRKSVVEKCRNGRLHFEKASHCQNCAIFVIVRKKTKTFFEKSSTLFPIIQSFPKYQNEHSRIRFSIPKLIWPPSGRKVSPSQFSRLSPKSLPCGGKPGIFLGGGRQSTVL